MALVQHPNRKRRETEAPPTPPAPPPRPLINWRGEPPTEDEFATWCEDPVTRFVATAYMHKAQQQRVLWESTSWGQGAGSPELLIELRTRADAFAAVYQSTWSDYAAAFKDPR
jgi:hypothetical protein